LVENKIINNKLFSYGFITDAHFELEK